MSSPTIAWQELLAAPHTDCEARALMNRHLAVLHVQEVGSPNRTMANEALNEAVHATSGLHPDDALSVCDYLFRRLNRGEIYDLNRGYLRGVSRRLKRKLPALPTYCPDLSQPSVGWDLEHQEFCDRFRAALESSLQPLLDYWIEDPFHGRQRRYHLRVGAPSEPTISRRMGRLQEQLDNALAAAGFDCNADGFIRRMHIWRHPQAALAAAQARASRHQAPMTLPSAAGDEEPMLLHDCLREALESEGAGDWSDLLHWLDDIERSVEDFLQVVQEQGDRMDTLYCRFRQVRDGSFADTLEALTDYQAMQAGTINLHEGGLAACTPEEQAVAAQLMNLAQETPRVPFTDLPVRLHRSREEVVAALIHLHDVCTQHS